jgi:hypothetical protein
LRKRGTEREQECEGAEIDLDDLSDCIFHRPYSPRPTLLDARLGATADFHLAIFAEFSTPYT